MQKTTQESVTLYLNPHSIGNQIWNPKRKNLNHTEVHQMSTHPLFIGPKISICTGIMGSWMGKR